MDEKQEIQSLRRELEQANYEYYVLDNPSMSDYDFDHKLRRLEELEAAMAGLPLDAQLAEALAPLHVEHYMSGITAEELARLLRG